MNNKKEVLAINLGVLFYHFPIEDQLLKWISQAVRNEMLSQIEYNANASAYFLRFQTEVTELSIIHERSIQDWILQGIELDMITDINSFDEFGHSFTMYKLEIKDTFREGEFYHLDNFGSKMITT